MYCTNCGCKNDDNAECCSNCGNVLSKTKKDKKEKRKINDDGKKVFRNQKLSLPNVIIVISSVVLIVSVIVTACVLLPSKTKKTNITTTYQKNVSTTSSDFVENDKNIEKEQAVTNKDIEKEQAVTNTDIEKISETTEKNNSVSITQSKDKSTTKATSKATTKSGSQGTTPTKKNVSKVSNWVLASQTPSGAEIVSQKWTYDLTTKKTSNKNSESGYTLENTTWQWSNYGSWSSWSTSKRSSSETRQIETRTTYRLCAFVCSKCGSHDPYSSPCDYGCNAKMIWSEKWVTTKGNNMSKHMLNTVPDKYYVYVDGVRWWFERDGYSDGQGGIGQPSRTEYRYRDRSKVYTYHFTKTESLESTTEITANSVTNSNQSISNIQKWVKYVVK